MILIMLGAPGTGKGTVSGILSKKLNIPQISTGDIFRKNIAKQTPLGIKVKDYLDKGQLVPDDVVIEIVENALLEDDKKNGVILDGFPRTIRQAQELDEFLASHGRSVRLAVNLTTPEDELINRVINRRVCPKCKATYNLELNPPKVEGLCDNDNTELITRDDDNAKTFKDRLKLYFEQTSPLIDYYNAQNKVYDSMISLSINKMGIDVANELYEMLKEEKNDNN